MDQPARHWKSSHPIIDTSLPATLRTVRLFCNKHMIIYLHLHLAQACPHLQIHGHPCDLVKTENGRDSDGVFKQGKACPSEDGYFMLYINRATDALLRVASMMYALSRCCLYREMYTSECQVDDLGNMRNASAH